MIRASPERVALYNYAHLPGVFKPQRRIAEADLPTPEGSEAAVVVAQAIRRLNDAGYHYVGMDHFSRTRMTIYRWRSDKPSASKLPGLFHPCRLRLARYRRFVYWTSGADIQPERQDLGRVLRPPGRGCLARSSRHVTADDLVRRALIQCLMLSSRSPDRIHRDRSSHRLQKVLRARDRGPEREPRGGRSPFDDQWITVTALGRTSSAISAWCSIVIFARGATAPVIRTSFDAYTRQVLEMTMCSFEKCR